MKNAPARDFGRADLLALLRAHRTPERIAHDLAKTADQSGLQDLALALACALDRRIRTSPVNIGRKVSLLMVGPHGAGKTAVAAKLAAHARLAFRAVKLIASDADGPGAAARLEALAKYLDVPFAISENAEALANLVHTCTKENVLGIIDSAGFDVRDGKTRTAFGALSKIGGVEAVGVVSACGDAEETLDVVGALGTLGAKQLVVTGVDLTRRLGALIAAATGGVPLAHITCSPYVAAGLEDINPLSLARAVLEASGHGPDAGSRP